MEINGVNREVRNLKTSDAPKLVRIIRTVDFNDDSMGVMKDIFSEGQQNVNGLMMIELFLGLSEQLLQSEAFLELVGGMCEPKLKAKEVKDLDLDVLCELIIDIYERPSTQSFFRLIGKLMS